MLSKWQNLIRLNHQIVNAWLQKTLHIHTNKWIIYFIYDTSNCFVAVIHWFYTKKKKKTFNTEQEYCYIRVLNTVDFIVFPNINNGSMAVEGLIKCGIKYPRHKWGIKCGIFNTSE